LVPTNANLALGFLSVSFSKVAVGQFQLVLVIMPRRFGYFSHMCTTCWNLAQQHTSRKNPEV